MSSLQKRRSWTALVALLGAVLLLVVGAKLDFIHEYGSDLPYWDQWDADGDVLLRPYLEGRLAVADVFHPHNEHRPAMTRLLTLGLFEAGEQQWDARVQMVVNTSLHALFALMLVGFAWRTIPHRSALVFAGIAVVLFTAHSSWENSLGGFQSQFYLVILFSALHIGGTLLARPRSVWWWLAPVAGSLALLSMASGLLAAVAVLAAVGIRAIRDRRLTWEDIWVLGVNLALVVTGFWLKSEVPGHSALKAPTIMAGVISFLRQTAWPIPSAFGAVIGLVPPCLVSLAYMRRRIDGPVALTLLGASAWAVLQAAAIAYARGAESYGYSSRYFDTNSVIVLVNLLSLAHLVHVLCPDRLRRVANAALAALAVIVLWGVARWWAEAKQQVLGSLRQVNAARIATVRDYVATKNPSFFSKEPWTEMPYPSAGRLAGLLDTPSLRKALPSSVRPPLSLEADPAGTQAFSRGAPAGAPPAPDRREAWFSNAGAAAQFTSVPLEIDHTQLTLFVCGPAVVKTELWLSDASGRKHFPRGTLGDGRRWKRVNFSVTRGTYRLHAAHGPDGWMGLTQPSTNAGLSRFAERVAGAGTVLVCIGALVGALAVLLQLPPFRTPRHAATQRGAVAVALGFTFVLSLAFAMRSGFLRSPRPEPSHEADVPNFGLSTGGTEPDQQFRGACFILNGNPEPWWGTYAGGDAFTGRLASTPFIVTGTSLHIPILGYPHSEGNSLALEVLDDAGTVQCTIRFVGPNPRERPGQWVLPAGDFTGKTARLILTDTETTGGGWLAVGTPNMRATSGAFWLEGVGRNYFAFAIAALALGWLLILPGLAWRTLQPDALGNTALVAVPGIGLFAAAGLVVWIGGAGAAELLGGGILVGTGILTLWLGWRWADGEGPLRRGEAQELGVYACVAIAALAMGVLPLQVAQEFDARSTHQARMIASPPDHAIPYRTAVYMLHGKSGREDRAVYFGDDWSVASRGPLLPLATAASFTLFREHPHDPPADSLNAWPASSDGYHIARILAVLANALVVLGGAALARRLVPESGRVALVWLAVAPLVAINTDFTWPKLLATFFVLLAIDEMFGPRRTALAAAYSAAAYLSHPVGGLFALPLATLIAHRAWLETRGGGLAQAKSAFKAAAVFGLFVLLCTGPWLVYKQWLGFRDVLTTYPLGDGRGFQQAASIASWLQCRWSNLWLSLVPAGFHFSQHMQAWIQGPLAEPLRWAIGYAKTLPGEVGLVAFCATIIGVIRKPGSQALSLLRTHYLLGAMLLILVYWGYSTDGLGRNCLEPLAALFIVYLAARLHAFRPLAALMIIVALEALSVRAIGVVFASDFRGSWSVESAVLCAAIIVATLAPAIWLAWPARFRRTQPTHAEGAL